MEIKIETSKYKCERCGHEWIPRKDTKPKTCADCNSPLWDAPRKNKIKDENKARTRP